MKARLFSIASALVACVACGGHEPAPQNIAVLATDAGNVVAPPLPRAPLGIPRDAIAVAVVDPSALLSMVGRARDAIEKELELPAGSLANLEQLGVDTKRGVTIALAPLTAAQRKVVDDLKPLALTHSASPGLAETAARTLSVESFAVRVIVPASDPKRLEAALGELLVREGWRAKGRAYTMHRAVIDISDDGSSLALDFGGRNKTREAFDAVHAAFADAHEAPPALDGQAARVAYSPAELARFGFLRGVTMAASAVSGGSVDPTQRDAILVEGLWEAGRNLALAVESEPTFDRVEITMRVTPFEAVLRAPIAHATPPPAALWSPTPSPTLDGATLTLDGSRAFANAWGSATELLKMVRDAGSFGWLVGLPRELVASPLLAPKTLHVGDLDAPIVDRFERTGISWTASHDEVFVGLLPASATRASAECALAPRAPCDAKTKLKAGAITHAGNDFAKLVEVDHRFVVLVSHESAALAPAVKLAPGGPARMELETSALASLMRPSISLPRHVSGFVTNESNALVVRVTP